MKIKRHILKNNSGHEIIFQEMIHIGDKKFYDYVKQNIKDSSRDGYKIYFEGVNNSKIVKEKLIINEKFNKLLQLNFNKNFYKNLSKVLGLTSQDNKFLFKGIKEDFLINADSNKIELLNYYENKYGLNYLENKVYDFNDLFKKIDKLKKRNKSIGFIFKHLFLVILGFLDFLKYRLFFSNNKKVLKELILEYRNEYLVKNFIYGKKEIDQKIFIVYGAAHFKGIFELLKKYDKSWEIIKFEKVNPIRFKIY